MSSSRRTTAGWSCALVAALLGVTAGLSAPGCHDDTQALAEAYVAAHDARAAAFCRCFGPLLGYRSSDLMGCYEGEQFEAEQSACVVDMLTRDAESSPDEAIECLLSVELDYAACLEQLECEDLSGLELCMTTYNDDARACPSLSERDRQRFVNCHFVE